MISVLTLVCERRGSDTIDSAADDRFAERQGSPMFVLDRLDATRIVSRASAPLTDPAAWSRPAPVEPRRAAVAAPPFSWRSLARNPNALVFTGMIGSVMAKDAVLRLVFKH